MDTVPVSTTELAEIEARVKPRVHDIEVAAQTLAIVDDASAKQAGELVVVVTKQIKVVKEAFAGAVNAAEAARKAAVEAKAATVAVLDRALAPLNAARETLDAKIVAWVREQQRIAAEVARRQEAEENERRRADHEAQLAAVEAENKRLADQRAAELAAAKAAKDRGAVAALKAAPVQQYEAPPPPAPAYVPPARRPKIDGAAIRTTWRCEVVTPALVPRQYLIPDEKALNALARAQGENFNVPGCRAVPIDSLSVRTK